ncbi:MAG: class II histone deacetylase [Haloarculaceae archaeon]
MPSSLTVHYDDAFLDHEAPAGTFHLPPSDLLAVDEPHPDRPERIRNITSAVEKTFPDAEWPAVEPASRAQLERTHEPTYLDDLRDAEPGVRLEPTTGVSEGTWDAAVAAAGAAVAAADDALAGGIETVPYAACRPSGHHAGPAAADGFCFVNNAAVAADHAIDSGAERVAILDWDVHHGNGTQECFYDRDDVLFVSLHNDFGVWGPNHPQEGTTDEVGTGDGEGYTVNVPLPPGTGDEGYAYAMSELAEPVVAAYDPDLLLVSAGQDPGHLDPMARNMVSVEGFEDLGARARRLAVDHAGGALGLIQEGGYQPSHLAFATMGVLGGALDVETGVGEPFFRLESHPEQAMEWVDDAVADHADYWDL